MAFLLWVPSLALSLGTSGVAADSSFKDRHGSSLVSDVDVLDKDDLEANSRGKRGASEEDVGSDVSKSREKRRFHKGKKRCTQDSGGRFEKGCVKRGKKVKERRKWRKKLLREQVRIAEHGRVPETVSVEPIKDWRRVLEEVRRQVYVPPVDNFRACLVCKK